MNTLCISCGSDSTKPLLNLGLQPPSNRLLLNENESCETHNINFDACTVCGLSQLSNPISPNLIRSRFNWLTYNEPEGHLDQLVDFLVSKAAFSVNTNVVGVTYKDDTTLARLNSKGFTETYRLSQVNDLGLAEPLASLETIQSTLSPELAKKLVRGIGQADVLIARHILEHAHQPRRFLAACKILCKQRGFLVFEVPDCRKVIDGHDHCFLWEEHISYFTPETLKYFLKKNGFHDFEILIYSYPMEDSLIAVVRNEWSLSDKPIRIDVDSELFRLEKFSSSFHERGHRIKKYLQLLKSQGQRIALFGAGHLAAKFINFYNLADCLVGVIDDNPNKLGRLMPGSKLPIIDSSCLENTDIDLCLLTLNPESEKKVLKAKSGYIAQGGKFRSIFSASTNSLEQDIGND